MLKVTKIELDLISDQDMYLFLMDTIRGGICQVNKKYSKADNKYIRIKYDNWKDKKVKNKFKNKFRCKKPNGHSMYEKLPYKKSQMVK